MTAALWVFSISGEAPLWTFFASRVCAPQCDLAPMGGARWEVQPFLEHAFGADGTFQHDAGLTHGRFDYRRIIDFPGDALVK
jgi:hypothetical protein